MIRRRANGAEDMSPPGQRDERVVKASINAYIEGVICQLRTGASLNPPTRQFFGTQDY